MGGTVSFFLVILLGFFEDTLGSDDEPELDEDEDVFFSSMWGTVFFFLGILLDFFNNALESDDEPEDKLSNEDDDDDDELLPWLDPLGGSGLVFSP